MKIIFTYKPLVYDIMRFSAVQLILSIIFSGISLAFPTYGQELDQERSFTWNEADLQTVIHDLEQSSDIRFVFSADRISTHEQISYSAHNQKLSQILDDVFHPLAIVWESRNHFILLKKANQTTVRQVPKLKTNLFLNQSNYFKRQIFEVQGLITDAQGEPVIGANVLEKGTQNGTVSDVDGRFSITVQSGMAVLVVSYVGMLTQEVPLNQQTNITIVLEEDAVTLQEVVAIGYAIDRKEDLSVAVSNVTVDDNFKGRPATIANILQGEMPGVRVVQNGNPGGGAEISIRGRGNRNGDGVLYVVDGVPNAPFHPSDVASVSVLKDAASAAIYGAYAGSGGVILITTKSAKEGDIRVSANGWEGYQQAWRLPEVLTAEQFNQVWADASQAAGRPIPAAYDPIQFPYGNVTRTDWIDAVFRKGRMQHYDLNIQGGTDKMKTLASLAYDRTDGSLINTWNRTLNARLNTEMKLAEWVKLVQRFQYSHSNGQSSVGDGHTGVIFGAMAYPRFASVYEYGSDGTVLPGGTVPRWALAEGFSVEADLFNPVTSLLNTRQHNPTNKFFSNSKLIITPIKDLEFRSDFSYFVNNARSESFTARFTAPGRTNDENNRNIFASLESNWNWENILTYNKRIDERHYFSVLGGVTLNYTNYRSNNTFTKGYEFENEYYTVFENAQDYGFARPQESIYEESLFSALGRISYSFDDRYFISSSLRRDASSKLSPMNNFDYFPAVSGAWKISSEPFFKNNDIVSLVKFRASWGQVGNVRSVRRFIYAPPYSLGAYGLFLGPDAENHVFGIFQSTIPNPSLKWERTEQTDFGFDIGLFHNQLEFTVDYFYKKTKDLIEPLPIPSVAGVASPPETNIGEVDNYGMDFSLAYHQDFGAVGFTFRGNLGFVRNNVVNLGARNTVAHGIDVNSMKPLQSIVGQPWYSYYLIQADGLFQNQAEIDAHVHTDANSGERTLIQPNAKPGDIRFVDANGDGLINDGDRQYMGAFDFPDFSYGFTLGLSWKDFDFSMFWQGVAGVQAFNGVKAMSSSGLKGWNMTTDILKSFEYDPNSGIPRLSLIDDPNGNYSRVSSYFLEDADYIRLKNINLSYTLPNAVLSQIGLVNRTIRIYVNAENALTLTKYSSFDPEVGNFGVDEGRFPVSRMYSVGLNISL